ncbi:hypothetical protein JYU34_003424 [Plutella xylostella]|uniref:Uncharacterized protein n=1 Tax=Plutella xylostella TaxID=51655 RepID=A0ABQ7R006_PLUXY|nr:hypothetical protein JYU34_003424 [Plutella xylostella]
MPPSTDSEKPKKHNVERHISVSAPQCARGAAAARPGRPGRDVTAVIKHSTPALDINPFENSNNVDD